MIGLRSKAVVCAIACGTVALAQNEDDALRYSVPVPGGGARAWGLAGAMGAVGADPAAASINPAGFGLYNTSELSLSLGLEVNDAQASFMGTSTGAGRQRMSVNNLALVFHFNKSSGDWHGGTFGLSYDRRASFQWKEQANGDRVPGTFLEQFAMEANGTPYTDLENGSLPFTAGLAWYTYGIDTVPGTNDQYLPGIPSGTDTRQEHTIDASGRMGTTSFYYAANYKDRLYIGAALGITGTRYERYTTHEERPLDDAVALRTVHFKEDLLTTGNGFDLKVGAIGRVGSHVRLGAAFHTPMWLLLNDSYSYTMTTTFTGSSDPLQEVSPDGTFSYRVTTPWSATLSAVYQAGKYGLVSVDYTYSDPRNARLRASRSLLDQYDYGTENEAIKASFRPMHTVRAGTEWRAGSWYFRVGGAWRPDPYAKADTRHGTGYRQYGGGVGYRVTHWSFDLGGTWGLRNGKYYTYSPISVNPVEARYTDLRMLFTVAWRP